MNIVFKELNESNTPKSTVENICAEVLAVPNVNVREVKKISQKYGKMNVIAELGELEDVNKTFTKLGQIEGYFNFSR